MLYVLTEAGDRPATVFYRRLAAMRHEVAAPPLSGAILVVRGLEQAFRP